MRCYECDSYICTCHGEPELEWVEITRDEIEEAFAMADNLTDFGYLVEAKCKAKNGYTCPPVRSYCGGKPNYCEPPKPDLLNQTCCGCGRAGGYALYCGWCWDKGDKPVGYVDQSDLDREGHDFWVSRQPSKNSVPLFIRKSNDT